MTGRQTIAERAAAFHAENPWVMRELIVLALEGVRAGHKRLGMAQLFEVLRWNQSLETMGDPWKLNNTYRAWYSRRIMELEPDLAGVFATRGSSVDDADSSIVEESTGQFSIAS